MTVSMHKEKLVERHSLVCISDASERTFTRAVNCWSLIDYTHPLQAMLDARTDCTVLKSSGGCSSFRHSRVVQPRAGLEHWWLKSYLHTIYA